MWAIASHPIEVVVSLFAFIDRLYSSLTGWGCYALVLTMSRGFLLTRMCAALWPRFKVREVPEKTRALVLVICDCGMKRQKSMMKSTQLAKPRSLTIYVRFTYVLVVFKLPDSQCDA